MRNPRGHPPCRLSSVRAWPGARRGRAAHRWPPGRRRWFKVLPAGSSSRTSWVTGRGSRPSAARSSRTFGFDSHTMAWSGRSTRTSARRNGASSAGMPPPSAPSRSLSLSAIKHRWQGSVPNRRVVSQRGHRSKSGSGFKHGAHNGAAGPEMALFTSRGSGSLSVTRWLSVTRGDALSKEPEAGAAAHLPQETLPRPPRARGL